MPYREQNSNKGTFGKVLNISGSDNYIGAAYLSAIASLKIGAGYVALASCDKVIDSVSKMLPEAVYIPREKALNNINAFSVFLIGCGLGIDNNAKLDFISFINSFQNNLDKPIIIDGDGLNILADLYHNQNIDILNFANNKTKKAIITPHPLEASRLLKTDVKNILNDLESSAKNLTQKYNCVTVLKTHRTLICNNDLTIYENKHGNSALAKAGTGDVLAGIIAGLVSQKMEIYEAAKLGVYLHSVSGEFASEELTEYSVLASDLIRYLPSAIKTIQQL